MISKGNFISTQSILVKKSYLQKYLFDSSLPRLQDYDLFLRLIPNLKVSFTNETLVDLYRQNNSISLYKWKIEKSISILSIILKNISIYSNIWIYNLYKFIKNDLNKLNKNYGFNLSQKKRFQNNLKRLKKIFHC